MLQTIVPEHEFTIGVCASDAVPNLPSLLRFLLAEDYGKSRLSHIVIVASGCPDGFLTQVRTVAAEDERVLLIEEEERHGKASAINRIFEVSRGEHMVMLNADAFPEPGAIRGLLQVASDPNVGSVSAEPTFEERDGLFDRSLSLMWSSHSLLSLRLNHAGISNHGCDELMVVRSSLVRRLPEDVVNDGAYICGVVRAKGFSVRFSSSAKVKIRVPRFLIDHIRQRRRILFGHFQVWKKLGRPPRTIESMLFMDPLMSLRTVVKITSQKPRFIAAIPLALACEGISGTMALKDVLTSTKAHTVWKRNVG